MLLHTCSSLTMLFRITFVIVPSWLKLVNSLSKILHFTLIRGQKVDQTYFFSIRVFFHRHWQLIRQQGMGGDHLLFHSTTSTCSWTFRHLFATLHVRWLSHIFNCNACIYQAATRWDFTTLLNYHLIDWWCDVCFSLCTWWFDTRFFLQQSWYGKPVDSNSHWLSPLHYKQTD